MSGKDRVKIESEVLFSLVKERYGKRLTPGELDEILGGIEKLTEAAMALRKIPLENGDEPFFVFKPFRGEK